MGTHGQFGKAPGLTILFGAAESNALPATAIADFAAMALYGPDDLDSLDFELWGNSNRAATAAEPGWKKLVDSTGAAIMAPGEGEIRAYMEIPLLGAVKIVASGNVGGNRTWDVTGIRTV